MQADFTNKTNNYVQKFVFHQIQTKCAYTVH